MIKFKKIKVSEPSQITDEKKIWYCNEVLPLKCKICDLESKLTHIHHEITEYCNHTKCKEHCYEECLLYRIDKIINKEVK